MLPLSAWKFFIKNIPFRNLNSFLFSSWERGSMISNISAIERFDKNFTKKYKLPVKRPYFTNRLDMSEQNDDVKNLSDKIYGIIGKGPKKTSSLISPSGPASIGNDVLEETPGQVDVTNQTLSLISPLEPASIGNDLFEETPSKVQLPQTKL